MMSVADEIAKLDALRQSGAITEEEYQKAKASLLEPQETPVLTQIGDGVSEAVGGVSKAVKSMDDKTWCAMIHFSQFCAYIVPLAGIVVPIVIWQVKKDQSKVIDLHGRIVANWMITAAIIVVILTILFVIFFPSSFSFTLPFKILLPGMLLFIPFIAFPIIGGIKANKGETWPYPLSIRFFSLKTMTDESI
tara:strand:- start:910 stop:1485 length:576 start_codon:yes stop_codon:yes gene_type:complete